MNKTLYRIIFNQARGQLMAVQETASGQGKGGGRGQTAAGARFAAARGFGFKLCALWVGVSLGSVALAADIVADPGAAAGKRPTVIQANSGLPVVQIAAPTAAGVSHNQYQQFNVGPKGVVLNNSAQVVNTQLAGYVGGNPNLAGGSARIILNEVTHANPSQLNGYLEVAGQRAQVVVANPWGISCSGCGFINTQQAMLTTGTPQLNAQGALTGFQVNGGAVSISGTGLNAGNVDKFAIISRALQVNAELHAKQLDLVLGRNQVDADTLQARPLAADGSAAPAFALDVAQLGGMYANAIRLVGTEAGVGVNQQGEMAARAGDLQLTSAGDLLLKGKTFSQQDMKLNSGGKLEHGGQTRSQGALQVAAVGAAQLDGSLTAGGALGVEAAAVAGKGSVAAGAQADGKLGETGALTLRSRASLDFHGELLAGGDASIQAGKAQLQGAVLGASHGDLRVTADGDLNASQAKLGAKGLARLHAGEGIQLRQGALSAGQLELQAKTLDNRGGLIAQSGAAAGLVDVQGLLDNRDGVIASQGKTLTVDAAAIDNRHGEISHAGADTLRVSADKIDNREQGKLHSDAKAEIKAAELDNAQGRLTALQGLELNASGALRNDGLLGSDGQLKLAVGKLENGVGLIQAGKDLQLTAASVNNADKGQILALGKDVASSLEISGQLNNQGKIVGNAGLDINAANIDNQGGTLQSAGQLKLEKQASLNNDGGHIVAKDLSLKGRTFSNQGGEVFAQQALDAQLRQLNNAKGSLIGSQSLSLSASEVLRNDGLLGSDGQLKLTVGQLENGAGLIQAGRDLQLTAASVNNADKGQILALGKDTASSLEISGQLNNQGKIAGNTELKVNAADIDNHVGTLQSAGRLKLEKQAGLNNDGGHIVAKDLNLKADTLSNQGGEVFAQQQLDAQLGQLNNAKGSLIGSQGFILSSSDVLRNDGLLGSDGTFKLTVGQLENGVGLIQAGKDLQLTAASVNNADKGQILALGKDTASNLEISGQLNNQGKIAGNAQLDINAADIDNHGGTLQSAGQLKLEKQASLNNDGGHIVAKDLSLKAGMLSNQGGEVFAQQQLDAQLRQLNNAKGSLIGSQGFILSSSDVLRNDGLLGSDGTFKLTVGQLENGAGLIQAGKDLQLTAASVNNADKGQILALGKDTASSLEISGQLNNQGKIAGNTELKVNAADIDNHVGTLQSAGRLKLEKQAGLNNDGGHIVAKDLNLKADTLSNQGGEVFAQQQLDAQLGQLNNAKGSLIGSQGFTLSASEVLRNDGLLGSDGTFKLTVGQLENGAGLIQAGKDLQLTAASVNNADQGQILALGKDTASSLEISGQLNNQGKIAGNAQLDINAADIDNHVGTLQSAGQLKLEKQAGLNNDGGHIVAKDLNLKADTLSNQGGEIRHLGQSMAQWQVRQRLDNQQGTLFSNGGLTLAAQSLNNQQGSLSSLGAQSLQLAQGLDNQGGALVSGQGLQLQLGAALNNQGGTVQAESLQLHAASLGNQGGSIKALGAGDGKVAIGGTLDNSAQGLLAGNGRLEVSALALDNRQGVLQSAAKLDVQVAQLAQNQGGKIQAGQLQLKAAELNNQQGLLSQAGDSAAKLELSGQLDNSRQGKVLSNGQLQVTAADLLNAGGTLSSQGDLQLSASGALDNRQGALGSNGALKLDSASVDNAGGLIQAGRTLSLDSGSLLNQGGKLLALGGGDSRVTLSGQLNNGGQIAGNGDWRIKAQGLDNAGGSLLSVGSLGIDAVTLGNSGSFLAGKDLNLTLASDFIHVAGSKLQANGKLSISSSGNLINSGQLQAGGDLVLSGVSWTNSGEVNAGGKLSAALSQALSNSGKLSAGALQLNAASVLNTHSITGGDISIQAASLDNGGSQGLIASAGNMALDIGQTLNNHDGSWLYSQGDMRIGKAGAAAGQVINHVATLQSDGNMFIDAGRVSNEASPVAISQSSSKSIQTKTTFKGYGAAAKTSLFNQVRSGEVSFSGFNFSSSCPEQGCDMYGADFHTFKIIGVNSDRRSITVIDPNGVVLQDISQSYTKTGGRNEGQLVLVYGEVKVLSLPGQPFELYYFGEPRNGQYSVIGLDYGVTPFDPNVHLLPSAWANYAVKGRDLVAAQDEVSRTTTTQVAIDVASGSTARASLLAGRSLVVNSSSIENKYSSISVGEDLTLLAGNKVNNIGQQLLKTVTTTTQSNFLWGRTASPIVDTHTEVLGSLDATISTGQKLSLQAPTISNGKASQLDISLTTGNNQPAAAVVNTAAGKALTQADGDAASAGKKLGGKPLDALASAQALAGPLTGAQAAADLQKSAVTSQAGAQWDGTKTSVLPQQVLLESAGTKAANPVAGGYSLPNNGLFQTRPAPAQPYLVETDPRFTQYNNFISSDYLLKQLGYDPSRVEKRLGDGFYEQQLVSRAVTELTGKRFIGGNANATQQYQQLMSQGAEYAKQFQLTPGVALSAEQMSRLTADMVWLVKQNVDSHDVLVPVVYLAKAQEQSLRGQGAVLAGSHMALLADGSLINSGTLKADNSLLAQANDIRIEGGKVLAGGDLGLGARHDLLVGDDKQHSQAGSVIQAGSLQLQAGNDLKLQAVQLQVSGDAQLQAGRDLDIASRENRYSHAGNTGRSQYSYQQVDHVGSTLQVGGSLGFNAGHDLTLSGAEVKAGGKLLAVAGNELTLQSTLDSKQGQGSWNGWGWGAYSTLDQTRHATQLQAGGDMLLQAGGNLALNGSQAQAGGGLLALAGKQLTVQSEVNSRQDRLNVQMGSKGYGHSWQTDSLTVAGLTSQGNLQLQAGGDAVLNGASLGSHSALTLSAGQDIRLGAVATQSRSDNYYTNGDIHNNYDLSQHGSALSGASGLALNAGRDITTQAASLGSDGQATLLAGRDITLGSAENRHSDYNKTVRSSGGAFSRKTTVDISAHDNTTQIGSTVSADKIAMQSGQDLNIQAGQVAGSGAVSLAAGRDLSIRSGTDTQRVFQFHQEKTSGFFSGGGIGFTVGSKELTQEMNGAGSTQSQNRSLVGSINGDLQLKAGGVLTLQGSDVTAGGNLLVDAKKQQLDAAVDTWHSVQKTTSKSSGLTVQITSPLLSGLQAVAAATDTLVSSKDDRVKALSAATAGLAGYNSYTAYQQAMAGGNPTQNGGGIKLSITVGGSQSESTTVSDSHTESGSLLKAGGNLFTQAAGAGQDSTIAGHGAQLLAGKDLTIRADGAITLLAAQSTSSERTTSKSSSGGVGVVIGIENNKPTFGFTANGSASRGKADGNGTQNQLSQLNAGGRLDIRSGGDFTLQGEARGQQIVGSIAGDLKLESLQDTSSYHSLNQSISGSVTIGYGSGGSVSLSQQKMDADYASVQQQSGIKAGDGGFQLSVKGSTQLTGAVIAGSAASIQQGKNSLSTGALVTKDIDNHADFTASSVTVTAGSGGVTGMAMAASDHDASTTRSGISGGKLEITNNALQQALTGQSAADAVAKLNRNVDSATDGSGKLANNFDKEQVQALFDAAAALHEQVGTFLSNKAQAAKATQDALDAARKDPAASASDLERLERAAADTKADADKWAPGGAYGQILTAVTAGIGGNLANGLGGMAQNAGIAYLQGLGAQQVKALVDGMEGGAKTPEGETVRAVLHAALACGGASASGQSCGAGAAGAAAAVALNNALDALQKTSPDTMTAEQKLQRESLVSGLLAGLSTATGGADTAATTVNAAKSELENNTLNSRVGAQVMQSVRNCAGKCDLEQLGRFIKEESAKWDKVVASRCEGVGSSLTSCGLTSRGAQEAMSNISTAYGMAKTQEERQLLGELYRQQVADINRIAASMERLGASASMLEQFANATLAVAPELIAGIGSTKPLGGKGGVSGEMTNIAMRQLDKKFKHAPDFGIVTTKKNPSTLKDFEVAITAHMNDKNTVRQGTYGLMKESKVYFNPVTNNAVVLDGSGSFVTGFNVKAGSPQYENYIKNGVLR
ncbi:hemagglutinin repeat-containing protein [Chromobacterium haemolyticum]|uniref:Hemagglutinin repeat-containing protein n=1 Tax=Chromobacterium haemolyticum TaxID=394935 RepID=A0ABS3GHT6_9NEIS|nr:hemagglutinin repeat-containing protein [Chromobacterium haemolyticum]MBK0413504.1 hemagglutinin repeat-containing protein [Chromobacterium haemolyticum]MBO0414606.1 hemagglutinin repeat-containing protein [Chromobacterium haemolyticum]MBO0497535.1 hemagglutinin repeat-containing protein [Chromobacterium haemolyticum]